MRVLALLSALLSGAAMLSAQSDAHEQLVVDYERAAATAADAAVTAYLPRFQAAADEHGGTETAVPLLAWIVRHGRLAKSVGKALDTLAQQHGKSLALGPVLEILPQLATYLGEKRCVALIDAVLAASGPPELEARALFARATMVMTRAGDVDEAVLTAAKQDLEWARKLSKDPALIAAMARVHVAARGLAIGDLMPEIAAFDLDSVPFRLSDYRGKVVVIDFWGDW